MWGMSSRFFQVTVVPTFTVSCAGSKVKLSIITLVVSVARAPLRQSDMAAAMANRPRLRRASDAITNFPLALQRRVDDREALIARLEVDAGNTEQAAAPGAGCGNAVERAVWKVTLPSTFCIT